MRLGDIDPLLNGDLENQEQQELLALVQQVRNGSKHCDNPQLTAKINDWCRWMEDGIQSGLKALAWEALTQELQAADHDLLETLSNQIPELQAFQEQLETQEITPLPPESGDYDISAINGTTSRVVGDLYAAYNLMGDGPNQMTG